MRVLITAPLRQDVRIFREYQRALDELIIPDGVTVDRFFVVNDCDEVIPEIRGDYIVMDTGDKYTITNDDHIWTEANLYKMPQLRNATIKRALDGGYDYWWSIDTDVIVQPQTLMMLIAADKDIVSEVFWTQQPGCLWCNAWMYDAYNTAGRETMWLRPGLYQVGMTGACTLAKTEVFLRGVSYEPIPNIQRAFWGEDRHFCVRAAVLGVEMWLDTHCPATHLYTENEYQEYMRRLKNG